LNTIVEQDHRAIKRRVNASQGFGVLPRNPTNNSGLRSGAHDPERPGEVVAQRGCGWSGLVHPRDARVAGLNNSRAPLNRLGSISQPFLQHFPLTNTTRYRRYQRTHNTITSPGYWRPLKGFCGLIGIDFYPIRMPVPKFVTEPIEILYRQIQSFNHYSLRGSSAG
jgi:hypothetical protein